MGAIKIFHLLLLESKACLAISKHSSVVLCAIDTMVSFRDFWFFYWEFLANVFDVKQWQQKQVLKMLGNGIVSEKHFCGS